MLVKLFVCMNTRGLFVFVVPLRYSKMPLLFKVDWVLHNVRFSFTLIVTILRWALQFEGNQIISFQILILASSQIRE